MIGTKLSLFALLCSNAIGFMSRGSTRGLVTKSLTMEYIPDGLTKQQWEQIKEAERIKKNLATMGTTRFKSRSFEAWQKAGAVHLFPVDPKTVSYEERPYMQRKGGDWEGKDLSQLGLEGKGQGTASKRVDLDNIYEKAKAEGKLDSVSIFGGAKLPWTIQNTKSEDPTKVKPGAAAKSTVQLSESEKAKLKANLAKVSFSNSAKPTAPSSDDAVKTEEPKKKLFGLF